MGPGVVAVVMVDIRADPDVPEVRRPLVELVDEDLCDDVLALPGEETALGRSNRALISTMATLTGFSASSYAFGGFDWQTRSCRPMLH